MHINDELGMRLHDRATLGEQLTVTEQSQLRAWYDEKDREEAAMLKLSPESLNEAEAVLQMRQVSALMAELVRQNNLIAAQNEALLSEVTAIRHQLADRIAA
ncbi:MAG: hypothetical protein AAB401_14930 [Acidobacteriota bacterium]